MRDDPGGKWLAGYAIALGLAALLALTQAGCCPPRPQARQPDPPARRTITVTLSCLRKPPPEHPLLAGDAAIDKARLEDAYDMLRLWALHAWAVCAE